MKKNKITLKLIMTLVPELTFELNLVLATIWNHFPNDDKGGFEWGWWFPKTFRVKETKVAARRSHDSLRLCDDSESPSAKAIFKFVLKLTQETKVMASTLENLPLDVRDRLLCVLPDFPTLRAAVLSCKSVHDTYALRKKSIFDEVAKNEAGPAMRYAVAVARGLIHMNDARWDRGRQRL